MSEDAKSVAKEIMKLLKKSLEEESDIMSAEVSTDARGKTAADNAADKAIAKQNELTEALRKQGEALAELSRLRLQQETESELFTKLQTARAELLTDVSAEHKEALEEQIAFLELTVNEDIANEIQNQADAQARLTEETRKFTEELDVLKKKRDELEKQEFEKSIENLAGKAFPKVMGRAQKTKKSIGNLGSSFTKSGKAMEKMGGSAAFIGRHIGKAGGALTKFSGALNGATLMAFAFVKELYRMGLEADKLSRKLGGTTGFGNVFAGQLVDIQKNTHMANATMEDASRALGAMANGLSSFHPNAKKTNEFVATTVIRMEKLGVAAASSVKSIEHMQKSMGMTAKDAANLTAQVARMGKEIGVTGTKMINDFNAASGRLAIYGKDNIKMFKELAAAAKASGIEMQSLLGISKKFDDFSGAADSISQLNAVLGTNLSTMEMMGASDAERVMMVKQQVQMQVGNFDSLDKYTKMYIAQAMGVGDVAEAQKLLNMSQADYMKNQAKQKKQADIQKEMAAATEATVEPSRQLRLAAMQLFVAFSPVVKAFAWMIENVLPFLVNFTRGLMILVGVFGAWKLAIFLVNLELTIANVLTGGFFVAIGLLVTALIALIGYLTSASGSLQGLFDMFNLSGSPKLYEMPGYMAEKFMQMKDAVLGAGQALANFASGAMTSLYDVFHWTGSPELWELPGIFAGYFVDMAESIGGVFGQMAKFVQMMTEFAQVDFKGFVAIKSDGSSTSMIMGSEDVITSLSEGKLTVDVKMPQITMPDISVKVYIGNRELKDIVRTEVFNTLGRAS